MASAAPANTDTHVYQHTYSFLFVNINTALSIYNSALDVPGEQVWHSGESTQLPKIEPRFDFQTWHHMWVEFVCSLLCSALL